MADILGYARVSTHQQELKSQKQRLTEAGAIKIFDDVTSKLSMALTEIIEQNFSQVDNLKYKKNGIIALLLLSKKYLPVQ